MSDYLNMTFSLEDIFVTETLAMLNNQSKYKIKEVKVKFYLVDRNLLRTFLFL